MLHSARPLTRLESHFLSWYNIGIHRIVASTARYSHDALSLDDGLDAIRSAIDIMIDRVPALSSYVAYQYVANDHAVARTPQRPSVVLQLCDHDVDPDPTSAAHRAWVGRMLDTPLDVRDPQRPPWRVHVARSSSSSSTFDVTVAFVYSHVYLDGMCGPYFHEVLAELLHSGEAHPYHRSRLTLDTSRGVPSMAEMWDFPLFSAADTASGVVRLWRGLLRLLLAPWHAFAQRSAPAGLVQPQPTSLQTFVLDDQVVQGLVVASRAHGVTVTHVMNACIAWALLKADNDVAKKSRGGTFVAHGNRNGSPHTLATMATMRPGYPGAGALSPGVSFASVATLDSVLPANSAFRRVFSCTPTRRDQQVEVRGSLDFWQLARDNKKVMGDHDGWRRSYQQRFSEALFRDCRGYQRRFLADTSDEWARTGLSPRSLVGLEAAALIKELKREESHGTSAAAPPIHILSNIGVSHLGKGSWNVRSLTMSVSNCDSPHLITSVTTCESGMVANVVPRTARCSDEEARLFARVFEHGLRAVAGGKMGEGSVLEELGE